MTKNRNEPMTPTVPSEMDAMIAQKTSHQFERLLADQPEYRFQLLQDDIPGQIFTIPASAMQLFVQMLAEMAQGNAVAVTPVQAEVTTQEAADLLNVSRPYVVKLLEEGEIPHRKVGTRRRIQLQDVLNYKRTLYAKRFATLNELTAYDQELGLQ